jgi:hypothetical protein
MRTTITMAIGATLFTAATLQMASAAEHHVRRDRASAAQEQQFRNSNAYDAAPNDFYAAPSYFAARPYGWLGQEQDEAAMTSGVAGH